MADFREVTDVQLTVGTLLFHTVPDAAGVNLFLLRHVFAVLIPAWQEDMRFRAKPFNERLTGICIELLSTRSNQIRDRSSGDRSGVFSTTQAIPMVLILALLSAMCRAKSLQ